MLINVKTNEELNRAETEAIAQEHKATQMVERAGELDSSLMGILRNRWNDSLRAKRDTETRFFDNRDLAARKYPDAKLAAIKEIGGSDVYIGIVETKNRHAKAWLRDAYFQPGQSCFGVEPTPSPEVQPDLIRELQEKFVSGMLQQITAQSQATGMQVDMGMAAQQIQSSMPELKNVLDAEVKSIVWDRAHEMHKEIDDKLVEGGWYEALDESIADIVELGTGVILGPIKRKKPVLVPGANGIVVEDKVVEEYQRISPFDVYPQSDSANPKDGWVFIRLSYRKTDLQKLIGVEGFDDEEIIKILEEFNTGQLREWTGIEAERAQREKKTSDTTAVYSTDKVDCLLYMGPLSGEQLTEAGIDDIPEEKKHFDFPCMAWFIGNHYLKVSVNEDKLERKPLALGHFEENVDGWWGKSLGEMIEAEQQVCNACARALVNNVAMGSGPQVEINIDRLRGGAAGDTRIIPWKRWLTSNRFMNTGQAINFWQPNMHAQEIMEVMKQFQRGADERSNIPAYAHGDTQVGGAGNTASGLSMLISQASRGIRGIVKGLDRTLIIPSVTFVYEGLAQDPKYKEHIGDVKLVAKGSSALLEKEQRTVRMLEFLNATNNPLDQQLMGAEGRGYLLGEVARAYEIDADRAMPRLKALKGQTLGQPQIVPPGPAGGTLPPEGTEIPNRGTPPVAARNLAPGGMEPQGGEAQLIGGRGGPPASPERLPLGSY